MAGVLDKVRKRMNYPIKLPNEETVIVRSMEIGEHFRSGRLTGEAKMGFILGCWLLNDDGSDKWTKKDKETDEEFGLRAGSECNLDVPSFHVIKAAMDKIEKVPAAEVLEKNSPETSTSS